MTGSGGRFYLGQGDTITLTGSGGTLYTFTCVEGLGHLVLAVPEGGDRPMWDFEPETKRYALTLDVYPFGG